MKTYENRGYLNSDFRLFHLTDTKRQEYEYHYHDFDKVIIFIRGHVTYMIEGQAYELQPYDIVLVRHNELHKPDIDPVVPYERLIVYLSPDFITSYQTETYDLSDCFRRARENRSSVLRIPSMKRSGLYRTITDLEYACSHDGYAKDLYCQVVFLEFMIKLNRAVLTNRLEYLAASQSNSKVLAVMDYINLHLTELLTVDSIASAFYISRFHLMHQFKLQTGYTIGAYIIEKRLLLSREYLEAGMPATEACLSCGFQNYSTFYRAYRKLFRDTPRNAKR